MNNAGIPVAIVHLGGSQDYLRLALHSAAKFNSKVVLIGDQSNQSIWKNHWDSDSIRCEKYQRFLTSYTKMSNYSESYEMSFWKRPFLLEHWMKEQKVQEVFLLDSDIVTFANYSEELIPILPDSCIATVMARQDQTGFEYSTSLHFSYWKLEAIEAFTEFCINAYQDKTTLEKLQIKYQWHVENEIPGGVCEMTLLHLWSEKNSPNVLTLTQAMNNVVLDLNVNRSSNYLSGEYETQFGIKKFRFKQGFPYGYNKILNQEVRFLCIHCQGKAKQLMRVLCSDRLKNFYHFKHSISQMKFRVKTALNRNPQNN